MDSVASADPNAQRPAMPDILVALGYDDSDDYFQQMLSIDSILYSLRAVKNTVDPQFEHSHKLAVGPEHARQFVNDVETSTRKFEELQAAARHNFNMRVRPLLRKVSILNLPDELLVEIFDCFSGWMKTDQVLEHHTLDLEVDVETIKNARLTCRRLRDASSHLLVPCLYITPSLTSLERLEQVTHDPTIAQGPRLFEINAGFYSAAIANDLRRFARMCYEEVRAKTRFLELKLEDPNGGLPGTHGIVSEMRADVEASRRILSSWGPLRSEEHVNEDAQLDVAASALLRGHERYRDLFEQQEEMLRSGVFARKLALAASKSKSNVWLSIWDRDYDERGRGGQPVWDHFHARPDLAADPDRLIQSGLLQTQQWHEARGDEADEAPQSLLYQLPLEMREAGARLVGFDVNATEPCKLNLQLSNDQLAGLREVAKELRVFQFCLSEDANGDSEPERSPERMAGLFSYLSAVMGDRNARELTLELSCIKGFHPLAPELFSIGPLLTSPSWPTLQFIQLSRVSIHLHQLRQLIRMLQSGVLLDLFGIYLLSGTWAEALDCLRSKAGQGSSLMSPYGAECEIILLDEYDDIFGEEDDFAVDDDHVGQDNMATQYITSVEGVENPLCKYIEATGADLEP